MTVAPPAPSSAHTAMLADGGTSSAIAHVPEPVPAPGSGEVVGVDRGVKVRQAIARLKVREADRRKDWVEKTSTDLARRFDVVRVEDLKITSMTRSAKGTKEQPGRNVAAKTRLNRAIRRSGLGMLVERLAVNREPQLDLLAS